MYDKKKDSFKSPELNNLQAVVIDRRTTIYIEKDEDPQKAIERYHSRNKKPE